MIQPSPLSTASSDILNNIPKINMGARSANAPLTQSYDKGPDVPLIEATIGDFFDAYCGQISRARSVSGASSKHSLDL